MFRRLGSTRNPRLRDLFGLQSAKERELRRLSLLEGTRFVLDALRSGVPISEVYLDEGLPKERLEELLAATHSAGAEVFLVAPGVLRRLSSQEAAQGVAATVRVPSLDLKDILGHTPLVLCHGLQNPGNLGAVVRVAAALGAGGVITSDGADPYGPKALRGAAASTYALPTLVWRDALHDLLETLRANGYRFVLAATRGGQSHRELRSSPEPAVLLLGGEGSGLDVSALPAGFPIEAVSIELAGGVDSLNVAVAAGILLDRLVPGHRG